MENTKKIEMEQSETPSIDNRRDSTPLSSTEGNSVSMNIFFLNIRWFHSITFSDQENNSSLLSDEFSFLSCSNSKLPEEPTPSIEDGEPFNASISQQIIEDEYANTSKKRKRSDSIDEEDIESLRKKQRKIYHPVYINEFILSKFMERGFISIYNGHLFINENSSDE